MTRKKRRALLCMLAVPLLALAPRSEESLPASAAEPAAVPEKYVALAFDAGPWPEPLRPPWGFLAPQTAAAVEVPMVYWSLDTEDWRRLDADAVAQDIIDHARDGDIILLHDPYTTSVEAALRAIDALTPQGYRFVTLEELFRQKGVEPEPGKLYIRPDELKRIA